MKFKLSDHAKEQMVDRRIPSSMVLEVAGNPSQSYNNDVDETVCQSKVAFEDKTYLLRVFVNSTNKPPTIISVYRTSKIKKYWRD
jgi:hypothetical protein